MHLLPIDSRTGLTIQRTPEGRSVPLPERVFVGVLQTFALVATDALSVAMPRTAMRMHLARQAYLSMRGYDAANYNRLTGMRRPSSPKDADSEMMGKHGRVRGMARDEVRNNGFARRAKRGRRNRVVGDSDVGQGMAIHPSILLPNSDQPDDKSNAILARAWEYYCDHLACNGRWGWVDLCAQADHELSEAGEVLAVLHERPAPGSDIPLSVENLEADRLPMDSDVYLGANPQNGEFSLITPTGDILKRQIKHGIEFDPKTGEFLYYHVLKNHPGDMSLYRPHSFETERIEARLIIHYFNPERSEQTRGISDFISTLAILQDGRDLREWTLVKAKMEACFGVHIPGGALGGPLSPQGGVGSLVDANGNPVSQLQPGMMTFGGGEPKVIPGATPSNTYDAFQRSIMREASAGLGQGYSSVSNDYSQGAYSALRKEANDEDADDQTFKGLHARHFCGPVWRKFVWAMIVSGQLPGFRWSNAADRRRATRYRVSTPSRRHINPLQEALAQSVLVTQSFEVPESSQSGRTPEDILRENGRLKKIAEEEGLVIPWMNGVAKPSVNGGSKPAAANAQAENLDGELEAVASEDLDNEK